MRVTLRTLQAHKDAGERFACVAAYDATFARCIADAGAEVILVGDSLGMVLQGHDSTLPVTLAHMTYHVEAVARARTDALIIGDMPFMSYDTRDNACQSAAALMRAGAHMVKLEGGAWLADTVTALVRQGTPVCAHLGLMPQSVNVLGGYRVQGRSETDARGMLDEAETLQNAGASLLVLECVPAALAARISRHLRIPVIGIGAGAGTDAQVLVLHDLLGLNPRPPRFVCDFMAGRDSIPAALHAYVSAVRDGTFPADEHSFQ